MKRLLAAVVLLTAACSGSSHTVKPTAAPPESAPPSQSAAPTGAASASPASGATPTATASIGPAGTKMAKGFAPQSATFISDRTGWALGSSPCPGGSGRCDVIARTRDGGATWRAIPSPATSPDHLSQIRFADETNGYVTGDQLWATHDGGATWKVLPGVSDVAELAAAAGRVWVNTGTAGLRSAPTSGGAFVAEAAGDHVNSFAVRGSVTVAANNGSSNVLVGAHGAPFHRVQVPCASGDVPIVGLGATHWLVVCEGDAGLGHQSKKVFRSSDRGATWTAVADPPELTGTDLYLTTDGDLLVDHQQVSVLRNGTWKTVLRTDGGLSEAGFESAALGFCIAGFDGMPDQSMKLSHDAGRTWRAVVFSS